MIALFISFLITAGITHWQIFRGYDTDILLSGNVQNMISSINIKETGRLPLSSVYMALEKESVYDRRALIMLNDIKVALQNANIKEHLLDNDKINRLKRPSFCPAQLQKELPAPCDVNYIQTIWENQIIFYKKLVEMNTKSLLGEDLDTYFKTKPYIQYIRCILYDIILLKNRPCTCPTSESTPRIGLGACENSKCPLLFRSRVEENGLIIAYIIENTFCDASLHLKLGPCHIQTFYATPSTLGADISTLCANSMRAAPSITYQIGLYDAAHSYSVPKKFYNNNNILNTTYIPFSDNSSPKKPKCSVQTGSYSIDGSDFCNGYLQFIPIHSCADNILYTPNSEHCNDEVGCKKCANNSKAVPVTGCFEASNKRSYIGWQCFLL